MAELHPDVSFPLFGGGSTVAVTDYLRLRLLHIGGTTVDKDWDRIDNQVPYWRIYLNFDDGITTHLPNQRELPLRAGHLYVIPAWLPWGGRCRGRVRHLNASLELPSLPREQVVQHCTRIFHLGGPGISQVDAWLRLGCELAKAERVSALHTAHGYALAYEAIASVFTQIGPVADGMFVAPGETRLEEVMTWIERNLSGTIQVSDLAAVAGCSRAELVRRFHSLYGTSPARWVRQRRIAVAADMLRCTDGPIELIAERCGFNDRSRFTKAFTAVMACGPGAWRRAERV